ncbi:MAG: YHS domain-containing (seleno)protein [Planctomycetota bacterium]
MYQSLLKISLVSALLFAAQTVSAAPATPTLDAPIIAAVQEDGDEAKKKDEKKKQDPKKDRTALKHYDLGKGSVALDGYDPVAYFPEYGGKPSKGSKKITTKHRGVVYRFASEANRKAFLADPERFEPAYGGWCAWAMADGKGNKTEANPKSFTIEGGRLYVFYDGFFGDTRKKWNKKGGAPKLASNSDANWKRISGEEPPADDGESSGKGK